jgi:UDPglucose 6-dehydrogenase
MQIAVIGAGYVGLTTASCLAEIGHRVVCVDNDLRKVSLLESGRLPFYEPYLAAMVERNRGKQRLEFTSLTEIAVDQCETIFICVGTPPRDNGEADVSAIERVARIIAERACGFRLVVEKSTVPVRTGRQLQKHLAIYKNNPQFESEVASNPEFLREGSAVEDFLHPDRIVVGAESSRAVERLEEIYRPVTDQTFVCPVHPTCQPRKKVPMVVTDIESAEIIKHAANSFLAMKVSFVNLMADLCEAVGSDVEKVVEGLGLDRRIGSSFLRPGIGFGGFCFPKDLQAFVRIGEIFGCNFSLLKEVEKVNLGRVERFAKKVKDELWVVRGKKIAVWGLSFKPNTDDVRFAPSLAIIRHLLSEGAEIRAYDPRAMEKAKEELPEVEYYADPYDAVRGAHAILALTEWEEFRLIDLRRVRSLVARPIIFDGRNMFSKAVVTSHGFQYIGIGRATAAGMQASVNLVG